MTSVPIPDVRSNRLIGLEVELDAERSTFRSLPLGVGWTSHGDGSLVNGREYVLESPVELDPARRLIEHFCEVAAQTKVYASKRGSIHVHVGAQDYGLPEAEKLAILWWKFQPHIDLLCGPSRRSTFGNGYCMPFPEMPTADWLRSNQKLGRMVSTRQNAKSERTRHCVNFAMLRCRQQEDRSIEFRQQSPSTKFPVIFGWVSFLVALVEAAKTEALFVAYASISSPTSLDFERFLHDVEVHSGRNSGIVEWAKWRKKYLEKGPSPENLANVYQKIASKPHGLFYIAKALGLNNAVTKKWIDDSLEKGTLVQVATNTGHPKYKCHPDILAKHQIKVIQESMTVTESATVELV